MRARALAASCALAAAACGRGAGAPGPACPHEPERGARAPIEVVLSSFTAPVRRDVSLAALAKYPGTEALGPEGKLQGLTVAENQLRYRTAIAVAERWRGPSCAWIDRLTVDLTPAKVEIIVPSDYAEGTCPYDQILAHERTHEDATREELGRAAEELRAALAKAAWLPARGAPIAVADRPEAEKRIERMVDKVAQPVYDAFQARLKERQAVIDLPENYRWTSRRCAEWR